MWSYDEKLYDESQDIVDQDNESLLRAHLAVAVTQNNVDRLKFLLNLGKGIDFYDECKNTLLHLAVKRKQIDILDYLLTVDGVPLDAENLREETALIMAIKDSQEKAALKLIEKGVDINLVDRVECSALHYAIFKKLIKVAEALIVKGINLNGRNCDGATPLYTACVHEVVEGVCLLLVYGADPTIATLKGESPFHVASDEIRDILFDYIYDEEKVPVLLDTFMKVMAGAPPLISKLMNSTSKLVYKKSDLYDFSHLMTLADPYYFKLFLKRFEYDAKILLSECDPFFIFQIYLTGKAFENLSAICESHVVFDFVKAANKREPRFGFFIEHLRNIEVSTESQIRLILRLLECGIKINTFDFEAAYLRFGFCAIVQKMLRMDIDRTWKYAWMKKHLMPHLICDVTMTIDVFLTNHEHFNWDTLDLVLEQFAHPKLKQFLLDLDNENITSKVQKSPQVPLLIELSRNVARQHIIEKYKLNTSKDFFSILDKLPVSQEHGRILSYETKLYSF